MTFATAPPSIMQFSILDPISLTPFTFLHLIFSIYCPSATTTVLPELEKLIPAWIDRKGLVIVPVPVVSFPLSVMYQLDPELLLK